MTLKISGSNGAFCGKCIELDIYGSGKSRDEVIHNIVESVKMYINSISNEELSNKVRNLKIKDDLPKQKIVDIICNSTVSLS